MEALVKSCNICWVWSGMPGHVQGSPKYQSNNISGNGWVILFICCMLLHIHESYSVDLVGHGPTCPKFPEATNHQYLWKGSCDFVDFLQAVICILLDIHWSYKNMLFWAGIVRHSLSANQIVRCFKLKKLKKDVRYQVDFLLPLKLEEILCYFGWWPQNTLGQSVCRIFDFWLVWLVKLNTRGLLLHCCFVCFFVNTYAR